MNMTHNVTEIDCMKNEIKTGDIVAWLVSDDEDNFDGAIGAAGVIKDIQDQGPIWGTYVVVAGNTENGEECNAHLRADEVVLLDAIGGGCDAKSLLKEHAARCHYERRYDDDAAEFSAWAD